MTTYLAHIICNDGEQAALPVPAGSSEAEIEQEAKERCLRFADIDWTEDEELIERGRFL
jgi:hypothetical protein